MLFLSKFSLLKLEKMAKNQHNSAKKKEQSLKQKNVAPISRWSMPQSSPSRDVAREQKFRRSPAQF